MNILRDPWLQIQRRSGCIEFISIALLNSQPDDPVVDILAPRPDFRGALYQLLIGLLQTTLAPQDQSEWRDYWKTPPDAARLQQAFADYVDAFEVDSDGPAFMQDLDLPPAETKEAAALLIEAPGEKTVRDNLDHFVQRGTVTAICPVCAATALFTLQINAPSGGVGHRVSLRGGGPMTTLLLPAAADASLWHKLWLNVLPAQTLNYPELSARGQVLPWMAATRSSDQKGVGNTTPDAVHPLQAYWSMPRRIRLNFAEVPQTACDLCGAEGTRMVQSIRARNYGANYTGAWFHPLTPYSLDSKSEKPPLSIKGQKGGIAYRDWLGLALGSDDHQPDAAQVVGHFNATRHVLLRDTPVRLWCFGFDMDNMKARCWYDSTLPIFNVPQPLQRGFSIAVRNLLAVAKDASKLLHQYVKAARFSRPGDVGSEPAVFQSFWQRSETDFYVLLTGLAQAECMDEAALAPLYRTWLLKVSTLSLTLFDEWILAAPIEDMAMQRVVRARADLKKWLSQSKVVKPLWTMINRQESA